MDLSGRWSSKEVAISISNVVDDFTITTTRQGSFYALRFPFIREYSCPYDAAQLCFERTLKLDAVLVESGNFR